MQPEDLLKIFHPYYIAGLTRLGSAHDGGYIAHALSLKDAECLVSYGVGYNIDFEKAFYRATGAPTLAFDPTLKELPKTGQIFKGGFIQFLREVRNYTAWMFQEKLLGSYQIRFIQEGISAENSELYKTFKYHLDNHRLNGKKIVLKMDVEGAEFDVFGNEEIYGLLDNTVQLMIEFHHVSQRIEEVMAIMNKLSKTHSLIHIHANNHAGYFSYRGKEVPEALELTYILNAYLPEKTYSKATYPIKGLDNACYRWRKDLAIDFF